MKKLLLVGTGYMAEEYVKVLRAQSCDFDVAGHSTDSVKRFEDKTQEKALVDGLNKIKKDNCFNEYDKAIVAVNEEATSHVVSILLEGGIKEILVEKPGGITATDIRKTNTEVINHAANVYVGYNRRFYESVLEGKRIINNDGGVKSFNFEFTEWAHVIKPLNISSKVKEEWFLANSTHVVDMAFFLGGKPKEMISFVSGTSDWHSKSMVYAGAGVSDKGALFSYQANWEAPGRWGVEILTNKHRLIYRPLEKLQIQEIGSVEIKFMDLKDDLDVKFKPGLYLQTKEFLCGNSQNLLTFQEHTNNLTVYEKMEGGSL